MGFNSAFKGLMTDFYEQDDESCDIMKKRVYRACIWLSCVIYYENHEILFAIQARTDV